MEKIMSCCGLICSDCPAFIAYKTDDSELMTKTAEMWSKFYNADITPDMIKCEGCHGTNILFHHCYECKIRSCCHEKKFENCSQCSEYICEDKLKPLLDAVPEAKEALEKKR